MDTKKFEKWTKEIHDTAVAHGWHEEKHSPEHYLGLIMTEVAEAVEADRENRYCGYVNLELLDHISDFGSWYRGVIKRSADEEFADIVIRLLDMCNELDVTEWDDCDELIRAFGVVYFKRYASFVENAWIFVHYQLGANSYDVLKSIQFMYLWAEHLGIDLDQHIEWKIRYNALRDYKHGGKKY